VALSIAGSDPSGGAGIQADLKTFSALGVYGASALTVLTVQNSWGVKAQLAVTADFVVAQAEAVLTDLRVDAIKLGMLGSADTVLAVAALLGRWPQVAVVLDPILRSTSGAALLDSAGLRALVKTLLPQATLLTPNLGEAAALLGDSEQAVRQAPELACRRLHQLGAPAVLLKGGHFGGAQSEDLLFDGQQLRRFTSPRLPTANSHGTGCTLAAAIAAGLAQGLPLIESITAAKQYLQGALAAADRLHAGICRPTADALLLAAPRHGPLHHFFAQWPQRLG
jgi:hydroxymethylpyrimidine/phosphomethylpyrimidine kinase